MKAMQNLPVKGNKNIQTMNSVTKKVYYMTKIVSVSDYVF